MTLEHAFCLAANTAGRFVRHLPARVDREQMRLVAELAAWEALRDYDPAFGTSERTWIILQVRNALLEENRAQCGIPRASLDLGRRAAGGEELEPARRGLGAGVSPALMVAAAQPALPLDLPMGEPGETNVTLGDALPDPAPGPEAEALERIEHEALRGWVDRLPARERCVVVGHVFEEQSLRTIAGTLGLSVSRASQLYRRALGRLRFWMDDEAISPAAG